MRSRKSYAKWITCSFVVTAMVLIGCANKKVGDACETYRSEECAGKGATCLGSNAGNYCTITCSSASECPAGWKCGGVTEMKINGKGENKGESVVKMCLKS